MLRMGRLGKDKMVGRYALGDELGRGSSARVFKALNSETGEFVAVKQIPSTGMSKEQMTALTSEVELMKLLKHSNIVNYLETINTKDYLYIVLEYVENGSLASILKRFGSLSEQLVSIYIAQVLDGLEYLHDQGVIHRDIKGANILITKEGTVKLADFGVATRVADDSDRSNSVVGTPYWMAPEIIKMSGFTTASDIWSLGCTCIELLTGEPPYFDLAPMSALFRIVQDEHPPLPADISPGMRDFCLKCFEKAPELRPTAVQMTAHKWMITTKQQIANYHANARDASRQASVGEVVVERPDAIVSDAVRMLHKGQAEEARERFEKAKDATIQLRLPAGGQSPTSSALLAVGAHVTVRGEHVPLDVELLERSFNGLSPLPPGGQTAGLGAEGSGAAAGAEARSWGLEAVLVSPSAGLGAAHRDDDARCEGRSRSASCAPLVAHGAAPDSHAFHTCSAAPATSSAYPYPTISGTRNSDNASCSGFLACASAAISKRPSFDNMGMGGTGAEEGGAGAHSRAPRWSSDGGFERSVHFLSGTLADMSPSDRAAAMIAASRPGLSPHGRRVERSNSNSNSLGSGPLGAGSRGFGLGDVRVDELARRLEPFVERHADQSYSSLVAGPHPHPHDSAQLGSGGLRRTGAATVGGSVGGYGGFADARTSAANGGLAGAAAAAGAGAGPEGARPLDLGARLAARLARTWHEEWDGGLTDYFASVAPPNEREVDLIQQELEAAARRVDVRELIASLSVDPLRKDVAPAVRRCVAQLERRPALAHDFAHEHGLMPLVELLQQAVTLPPVQQGGLVELLLQLCNELAASGAHLVCENLCLLGAIPAIASFAGGAGMPPAVHLQISLFLNTVCRAGSATLAMLVASDALPVIVSLLDPDLPQRRDQTLLAVDSLWCLFQTRSWRAPRADFCRLLGAQGVHERLARVLHISGRSAEANDHRQGVSDTVSQAADVLLLFSHAEETAARGMLTHAVLQDILLVLQESKRFHPQTVLTVVRCLKNLSMGPTGHVQALQRAGAVVILVHFLDTVTDEDPHGLKMRGQVLLSLYHLCKLNRLRQEQAVVCPPSKGIVPHLQDAVVRSTQLKHVALPMLCDIARASKRSRTELWKHSGANFYLELLAQEAWRDDALEALAAWLADEPRKVEAILEKPESIKLLVEVLDTRTPATFENLLDSLKKILHASSRVNQSLGDSRFVPKLVERLNHPTPVIRVNLLRMLTSIYEHHRNPKKLVMEHNLRRVVERMAQHDKAVLVKEIAGQLQKAFKANDYL